MKNQIKSLMNDIRRKAEDLKAKRPEGDTHGPAWYRWAAECHKVYSEAEDRLTEALAVTWTAGAFLELGCANGRCCAAPSYAAPIRTMRRQAFARWLDPRNPNSFLAMHANIQFATKEAALAWTVANCPVEIRVLDSIDPDDDYDSTVIGNGKTLAEAIASVPAKYELEVTDESPVYSGEDTSRRERARTWLRGGIWTKFAVPSPFTWECLPR